MDARSPHGSFHRRLRPRPSGCTFPSEPPPTDAGRALLLLRAGGGDRAAFARLYDRTAALVHARSLELTATGAEAEEATLAAFLEIWRRAPQWRGGQEAVPWMLVVTDEVLQRLARPALPAAEVPSVLRRS